MANCAGIFQGQDVDCQNPLAVGTVQRALIANREDVASIDYSVVVGEENVITAITMKSGTSFYEFLGVNESISTQNELVRRTVSNGYKHTLDFSIFEVDNITLQNMQAMAYTPQIAIVYGVDDTSLGNGAFQVLGVDAGLDLITNIRINGDVETGGAHRLQLATPDTGGDEKMIPPVFWDTDYQTTLIDVDALLTPTP
jgi:hypothetical protein